MQRIAGEHRGPLVKGAVDGRLAAPDIVIVHARHVVMNEAVAVDAFDRERDPKRTLAVDVEQVACRDHQQRSEEHTSEVQSLMRISYAVFCLKKKNHVLSSMSLH